MVPRKLIALTAAALIALLATGSVSDRSVRVMDNALQWVNHSRDVLIAEGECREFLLRAESTGRAYALTGAPEFAAESDRAVISLRARLAHLRQLTSDNPTQQRALAGVMQLVDRRVAFLHALAVQKKRGADLAALQASVMNGARVNAEVDRALDGVHAEELRLLEERKQRAESARKFAIYGPWVMIAISTLVAAALMNELFVALRREGRARIHAEQSDRLKDDFLATVSHELRTPLTAILGWAAMLERRNERPELIDTAVANIAAAARNQSRLVDDLLDVSRIITGTMKLDFAPVDLKRVVEEAIASIAPPAKAKDIEVKFVAPAGVEGVQGDSARLLQVVWNVLSNAVKFTPRGGHIEVALQRQGSHATITVTDDGDGIAKEFLPHVFERFAQGDGGPTRRTTGLGLGLSIVKQIVELHGGSVRIGSDGHGFGTCVTIELPAVADASPAERERERATAQPVL